MIKSFSKGLFHRAVISFRRILAPALAGFVVLTLSTAVDLKSQDMINQSTGRVINRGLIKILADSGQVSNAQADSSQLLNAGVIELHGRYNRFNDLSRNEGALGAFGNTAWGVRTGLRIGGLVRYTNADVDTQYVQARYFTNLELAEAAPKYIEPNVFVGGLYSHAPNVGVRLYHDFFNYDGNVVQQIWPENSTDSTSIVGWNRYVNVGLLVSDASRSARKIVDTNRVVRLDGILRSRRLAPLVVDGQMYLGYVGTDSSITSDTVFIRNNGLVSVGQRPILMEENTSIVSGALLAQNNAGAVTIGADADLELLGSASRLEFAAQRQLYITGRYFNRGDGRNVNFDKSSQIVFNGIEGQEIERTIASNPYGNVWTIRGKSLRDSVVLSNNLRVQSGNIRTGVDALIMTDANSTATYVDGLEEVVGTMSRQSLPLALNPVTFNNRETIFDFSDRTVAPTEVSLTVTPQASPNNTPLQFIDSTDVNRRVVWRYTGNGDWEARVRIGYRSFEATQAEEASIEFFEATTSAAKKIQTSSINPAYIYNRRLSGPTALGYVELNGIRGNAAPAAIASEARFATGNDLLLRSSRRAPQFLFTGRATLEGAYRDWIGEMSTDLRNRNLIGVIPPDNYPYNLDPFRQSQIVTRVPDSVVDWVTVEMRSELAGGERYFRNCFLRSDGSLVDLDGTSPVRLPVPQSGQYYAVLRHRNHLSVMTASPVDITTNSWQNPIDFANPTSILGGISSLTALAGSQAGVTRYGLIGGDRNFDGVVDANDYNNIWDNRDWEGYLYIDTDMTGIVHTSDYNLSWNNRTRRTNVP